MLTWFATNHVAANLMMFVIVVAGVFSITSSFSPLDLNYATKLVTE